VPFSLSLPARCRSEGWRVKIREKERNEPPHVTILRRTYAWRLGLRDAEFLVPPGGSWSDIDQDVKKAIEENWDVLRTQWDAKYPENPIGGADDDG
jgi:hypothetical protein